MDKASESYAQKILAEIRELSQTFIAALKAEPHKTKEPEKFDSGSQNKQDNQLPLRERTDPPQVIAKVKPSIPRSEQPNNRQADSYPWLTKHKPLIEFFGFLVLGAYTSIAFWQGCETRNAVTAAQDANRLNEESTRARLTIETKLSQITVGKPVKINIRIKNLGHSVAAVKSAYGFDFLTTIPDFDITSLPVGQGSAFLIDAGEIEDTIDMFPTVMTDEFLAHIPSLGDVGPHSTSDPSSHPRTPVIYLYGRIQYETLGRTHEVDFCYFVTRNDPSFLPDNAPTKNDQFITVFCAKGNTSN